jgi:translocation and assembly module TamB
VTKRRKILLTITASLAGLLIVFVVASVIILQSAWFANFVRGKIISLAEESTGGRVELGSFQFDWTHLTVRIRNFVLHGTEPQTEAPLARVALLEVRLKLLSALTKPIDLQYLGIDQPQVNFIVFPDGKTNVPTPKVKKESKPSGKSPLETVIDLAVGRFQIENGLLAYAQQKSAFSLRGERLHVLLNYNTERPRYEGNISIDPVLITSGTRPPLHAQINLPLILEKDAVRLTGGKIGTPGSNIALNASLRNLKQPEISASLGAKVSLPEMARSFDLPIDAAARNVPKTLNASVYAGFDAARNAIRIQTAHVDLGQTTVRASGQVEPGGPDTVQFNISLALAELAKLFKMSSLDASGALLADGTLRMDAQNNYVVNGMLNSHGLAVQSGATRLTDLSLRSPFHADPYLVSLDSLKFEALGGSLGAKVFLEKMQQLNIEGNLRNFSMPVLAAVFTGKQLGYDGVIDGTLKATGDLKAKGTSGYNAQTRLTVVPGARGVPVNGYLAAVYRGASDTIVLEKSYLALPSTRLDLSGSLNERIDLNLVSRNLNDFLPAANFGAEKPMRNLPVELQGGTARLQAEVAGKLTAPRIASHLALENFAVEQRTFDQLALNVEASPSGATIRNGLLTRRALQTNFDATIGMQKWSPQPQSPVNANLMLRNGELGDLMSLAGSSSTQAAGQVTADIHVNGTYGNPLGGATIQVLDGSIYQQPFSKFYTNVALTDQLITLSTLEFDAAEAQLKANGAFRHPRDSLSIGHVQLHLGSTPVQLSNIKALRDQNAGIGGVVQLTADTVADLQKVNQETEFALSNVSADFSAHSLQLQNQDAGDLTATARTTNGIIGYNVQSNFAGSNVRIDGKTSLAKNYLTTADANIQDLSIEKTLQIIGQPSIPAKGNLSANAHVTGNTQAPDANLSFNLTRANLYQEAINRLQGSVRYNNSLVDIPSINLNVPAGSINVSGSFRHQANDFKNGALALKLTSTDIDLNQFEHVQRSRSDLEGTVHLAADLAADLREQHGKPALRFSRLNAEAATKGLQLNDRPLGEVSLNARTSGQDLQFRFDSNVAQSQIHAFGQSHLTGDYPSHVNLSFANIKYSNLAPFLEAGPVAKPAFEALVEGEASMNGPIFQTDALTARLELKRLEFQTQRAPSPTGAPPSRAVNFHNDGAIVIALNRSVVNVEHFAIEGPRTKVTAGGRVNFKDETSPLSLSLNADADLGVLQDADRDFYSSGQLALNAAIRGTLADPAVNGQLELKNANINYASSPSGLSNANGVILLNGRTATIQNLTGESGGGKIELTGFVGLARSVMTYNLRAAANKVRVRYSGISVTSNATINLVGSSRRSLLNGTVTIQRIVYGSSSDAGSFLSQASTPPTTPSAPSPLLSNMRLNIRVLTAPDLRVVTTYANRLAIEADLNVRGNAATPGVLGAVHVTDGQLVFFGNQYTVNTGTVNFYNPNAIEPVLNFSLETIAQNVDVTLGVSGPIDNLQLSYRSDPPLTFQQIVQLLATNTTPSDPTIAAHQQAPAQQSLSQMGESAILSQAVANPLASRVQRVFGLTQFKIDPSFQGTGGQPTARVTLQQRIASNVTFTYITDVTQTNNQIIRVEWAFTPKLSAVALRDFNGNVSLEFFYKFKVR